MNNELVQRGNVRSKVQIHDLAPLLEACFPSVQIEEVHAHRG